VQELQQDVLDILADVAGLGQRGGVADGEGDVEDPRGVGMSVKSVLGTPRRRRSWSRIDWQSSMHSPQM